MSENNTYTIYYFGSPGAYSSNAAEKARSNVSNYLAKADRIEVPPSELSVKGVPDRDALEGLIEKGDPRHYFVVPVVNSKAGDVSDFLPFFSYQFIGETEVLIKLMLCSQSGKREDVRKIVTKNTAFQQVIDELIKRGFDVEALNGSNEQSTVEGALAAKRDASVAALCSPEVCRDNGLIQVDNFLAERTTTFGIFVNASKTPHISGPIRHQYDTLIGNSNLYTGSIGGGGKVEFVERLNSGIPLLVKWGVDPLNNRLHLGHLACLYKLKHFLDFKHKVVVVLGTFTGLVGDPSGNLTPRPHYEHNELEDNAEAMKEQIRCVLGEVNVSFQSNAILMKNMNIDRLLKWGQKIDQSLLLERTDFQQRLKNRAPLFLSEMLYGLFQAYDTLALNADIEIGGSDQLHNAILMRSIFAIENRLNIPFALLIPVLPGLDFAAKMSSFMRNEVYITDSRDKIKERLSKINNDKQVVTYLRLLSDMGEQQITKLHNAFERKGINIEDFAGGMADAVLEKLDTELESIGQRLKKKDRP